MITTEPIEDRSLSRLVGSAPGDNYAKAEVEDPGAPENRSGEYKYAKQTQFAKTQNERNCQWTKGLYKYTPSRTVKKQTQFRTRRTQYIQYRKNRLISR